MEDFTAEHHRHCEHSEAIQLKKRSGTRMGWEAGLLRCARNDGVSPGKAFCVKEPAIYIMANRRRGTLYTGVTANLPQRVLQHKGATTKGFTAQYNCRMLVYYEYYEQIIDAISREKQIKAGSREKKIQLIETMNPDWRDLFEAFTA